MSLYVWDEGSLPVIARLPGAATDKSPYIKRETRESLVFVSSRDPDFIVCVSREDPCYVALKEAKDSVAIARADIDVLMKKTWIALDTFKDRGRVTEIPDVRAFERSFTAMEEKYEVVEKLFFEEEDIVANDLLHSRRILESERMALEESVHMLMTDNLKLYYLTVKFDKRRKAVHQSLRRHSVMYEGYPVIPDTLEYPFPIGSYFTVKKTRSDGSVHTIHYNMNDPLYKAIRWGIKAVEAARPTLFAVHRMMKHILARLTIMCPPKKSEEGNEEESTVPPTEEELKILPSIPELLVRRRARLMAEVDRRNTIINQMFDYAEEEIDNPWRTLMPLSILEKAKDDLYNAHLVNFLIEENEKQIEKLLNKRVDDDEHEYEEYE